MKTWLALVTQHGYVVLFLAVLAEAIGLPLPASLVMIAAGAAAASHLLNGTVLLLISVLALEIGDSALFVLGRYTGWALLGLLCRVSLNPETCILRSAESFYKRGKATLLMAKFIPGLNAIAAPLAGSMKMRPLQFLRFDLAGAFLYAGVYFAVGFLFRDFLAAITQGILAAGHAVEVALLAGIIVYACYRLWLYRKYADSGVVPRITVGELARRLTSSDAIHILLVDVRSHGYYDAGAERIKGSIRIEPNKLRQEIQHLPKDKEIYLYCT
jgi:membrane protein DedA with SNARE-associated domain